MAGWRVDDSDDAAYAQDVSDAVAGGGGGGVCKARAAAADANTELCCVGRCLVLYSNAQWRVYHMSDYRSKLIDSQSNARAQHNERDIDCVAICEQPISANNQQVAMGFDLCVRVCACVVAVASQAQIKNRLASKLQDDCEQPNLVQTLCPLKSTCV